MSDIQTHASMQMQSHGDIDRARRGAARVFRRLVWLYTAGESSSVSQAEAMQLLGSMAYVLGAESLDDPAAVAVLGKSDVLDAYEQRRIALARRASRTSDVWHKVASTMPQIPNKALVETMASVKDAPQCYDAYFHAQEVPAELAYHPHGFRGDGLAGIDAVEAWLDAALAEAQWLSGYPTQQLADVLQEHQPGYLDACTSLRDLAEPYM